VLVLAIVASADVGPFGNKNRGEDSMYSTRQKLHKVGTIPLINVSTRATCPIF
jgi:hypothetical protein